jgi:hypothetical protein
MSVLTVWRTVAYDTSALIGLARQYFGNFDSEFGRECGDGIGESALQTEFCVSSVAHRRA